MSAQHLTRRQFVKETATTAAAVGAAAALAGSARQAHAEGASDRLRIGFIGPGGRGFDGHVKTLARLRKEGANIDLVAVCDVYTVNRDRAVGYIKQQTGTEPKTYRTYKELIADDAVDAVAIGTPDHWHALPTIAALQAGKHVYCEKPMTKTVAEAFDVVDAWKSSGKVMQVGVQSTTLPCWDKAREMIDEGQLGKLLQVQTGFFRNSNIGQWRYYPLTRQMTPETIDWRQWLGVDEGLGEEVPFDRAIYAQWRRFWPYGAGMYTDLFVHRLTSLLKATGLRSPRRVCAGGGIFLEYDGRDVPDVATLVADYECGAQTYVSGTMVSEETGLNQIIRGHHGALQFANGEYHDAFDFVSERPQVTGIGKYKAGQRIRIEAKPREHDTTVTIFRNWLEAIEANDPSRCTSPPDLGAAAIVTVNLAARSYREGKVFFFDEKTRQVSDQDPGWSKRWEQMSEARAKPLHVPGWQAGDTGSLLKDPAHQKLEGPWIDGKDPAV